MGKQLTEAQVGVFTGLRLVELLPSATVQAGYTYAFVEKAIDEISVNRSNVFVDFGYAVKRRLYVRAAWLWEHTHGGKRIGSPSGDPFLPPGELDDGPGWLVESNRIRKVRYMQLTGGLVVRRRSGGRLRDVHQVRLGPRLPQRLRDWDGSDLVLQPLTLWRPALSARLCFQL